MTDPIEVDIRQGRDYMSPQSRALYCQFQVPDTVEAIAADLVESAEPGPARSRHVALLGQFVKSAIDYDSTGRFPRASDLLLTKLGEGDCVDQSVLLISLLEALDIDARYCCYREHGARVGHCVVEVPVPDTNATITAVEETLRSTAEVGESLPIAWDIDDSGRWLLIDPTCPRPVGFDRGERYSVTAAGIDWPSDTDIICFRPYR